MRKTRIQRIFLCSLCILLSMGIPTFLAAETKDTLIVGLNDNTVTLDPAKTKEAVAMALVDKMYQQLVTFEKDDLTQVVPEVAESWDISEDGKTWTFHLRQGIVFSTGNPVNADTVVFSLQRALQLEGDSVWMIAQIGMTPEGISKIDEYTVQIEFTEQFAPSLVLACLTTPIASILDPKAVMEHEQDGDMGSAWLDMHSAGSGRFMLQERHPGEMTILQTNERYTGSTPLAKTVIAQNIPDPFEQAILLDKGEIDVAWDLQPSHVRQFELNPDVQSFETRTFDIRFIGMNLAYKPLSNPQVRDAIRYAIDYDALVDFIIEGAGEKIQTIIPKGLLGYNPAMPYDLDPEKAKRLLADAGYPDGFEVELVCGNSSPWIEITASVKRDLAAIGINVVVKELPISDLLEVMFSRQFQMYLIRWESDYPDPDANAKSFAHCDSAGKDATVQAAAWLSRYVDAERSELVEQAAKDMDKNLRTQHYLQITEMVLDDGPYIILFSPLKQYGVRFEARHLLGTPSARMTGFPPLK